MKARSDGRASDQVRKIEVIPAVQKDSDGSVLIKWGDTHVICAVNIEEKVPNWMKDSPEHAGGGWITAEYGMLPGCSDRRIHRDKIRSTGRTHEIQRLIGRSIRACVDMKQLGPRTVQIDCDVIQADGGTRVASITGSYLAFRLALFRGKERRAISQIPKTQLVAGLSLGRVSGEILVDLNYVEDVKAEVDANLVMNELNEFIEIQGTAEKGSFSKSQYQAMIEAAEKGFAQIFEIQRKYLREWGL